MILKRILSLERCHGYTVTERDIRSPIPVSLTTIEHPLFLWLKKAQRKSLAKRHAAKPFRRCDGEEGSVPSTCASFLTLEVHKVYGHWILKI